ncbi:integrase [Bacillus mycoides]|uniref:Integrase n=1 Tax=Bacillus mycoides TaxID=1405 RepID=A0A1W6AE42_BACMY|nr:site-specific integrase [Bacillus mycoides]ARJ24040.1 integrase [Bacillus mycoides]
MENIKCVECSRSLSPSGIKKRATMCDYCMSVRRVEKEKKDEFLKGIFQKKWSANLFRRYIEYLESIELRYDTIRKLISKARIFFVMAEQELFLPQEINSEWLYSTIEKIKGNSIERSMTAFLIKEELIIFDEESVFIDRIESMIENTSKEFNRLLEIYYNERLKLRQRQVKFNARNPLSFKTIISDLEIFKRFIKYLINDKKHINSWNLIQQEDVHDYLLTLRLKNREIVRKRLLVLFKLAFKKKVITHLPLAEIKSRELPLSEEPLSFEEQKKVARLLEDKTYDEPLSCLLTSFCFYHGLSSQQIRNIKLQDINLDKETIYIDERPPVYLLKGDMLLLQEYARIRKKIKNIDRKIFLIVSSSSSEVYTEKSVSNRFVRRKVKDLTGYAPKTLRLTCLQTMCAQYGPQLLIEGFGLSLTQASRYGKMEGYLIEEVIKEQRDSFNEFFSEI